MTQFIVLVTLLVMSKVLNVGDPGFLCLEMGCVLRSLNILLMKADTCSESTEL